MQSPEEAPAEETALFALDLEGAPMSVRAPRRSRSTSALVRPSSASSQLRGPATSSATVLPSPPMDLALQSTAVPPPSHPQSSSITSSSDSTAPPPTPATAALSVSFAEPVAQCSSSSSSSTTCVPPASMEASSSVPTPQPPPPPTSSSPSSPPALTALPVVPHSPPSSLSSSAAHDDEELTEEPALFELSLCSRLLEGLDARATARVFRENRIAHAEFCANPGLLYDDRLVCRLQDKYYPWSIAGPIIISILAFGRPLDNEAVRDLEAREAAKYKELPKEQQQQSGWRWWWRRGSKQPAAAAAAASQVASANVSPTVPTKHKQPALSSSSSTLPTTPQPPMYDVMV